MTLALLLLSTVLDRTVAPSPFAKHPPGTVDLVTRALGKQAPLPAVRDGGRLDRLLRGLTDAQRVAVTADDAPLCLLAGAGSGKTRVLTRRVARRVSDGSAEAEHVLVVTFTRKAAAELRERIERLGVPGRLWAGTFHAAAYAQLHRHWADHDIRPPTMLEDPEGLLREIFDDTGTPKGPSARHVAEVAAELSWAQSRLVSPAAYADAARSARRRGPMPPEKIAELYHRYDAEKRRRGLIDLGDLLDRCASVLETDEEAATAQRWRIRHLFVDEFQDVNLAQWRLLRAWLGDRTDLFVVGDARQAVYGWNGADPTLLARLPELLPGTSVLRLDENHRSTPQIVQAASSLLPRHVRPATERPDGPPPVVASFDSDEAESVSVARWLRQAHRPGRSWSQLAVLARTNARLEPVADALGRFGIPHRLTPLTPADIALRRAIGLLGRAPARQPLRNAMADVIVTLQANGTDANSARAAAPPELARLVDEHAVEEPGACVGDFLAWLVATVGDPRSEGQCTLGDRDRVELTTFHKAKGLEWPAVAVVGLEDGIVPIVYATTPEALAEERRLFYVALTRAEEELWCSWSANRGTGERNWACERSPFLDVVEDAARDCRPAGDLESCCARISDMRSRLRQPVEKDPLSAAPA
jgi:DNA helicase-2/ATP-dependent DNA helicase PcrA